MDVINREIKDKEKNRSSHLLLIDSTSTTLLIKFQSFCAIFADSCAAFAKTEAKKSKNMPMALFLLKQVKDYSP